MQGLSAVFKKEFRDHFSSYRFVILFALIAMISFISSYMAAIHLRENLGELADIRFPFLMVFSTPGTMFSMVQFVAFFGPLLGLVLGFDAINRERVNGTLIKLISQPIYRDSVINGKFLAGVAAVAIILLSILLIVSGFSLTVMGVVPGIDEIWRLLIYFVISIFYISFWLGISILFSVLFKNIATSALASVALWIFLSFFVPLLAEAAAKVYESTAQPNQMQSEVLMKATQTKEKVSLFSPTTLYSEATGVIIDPMRVTASSVIFVNPMDMFHMSQFQNPLPLVQSIMVVSPHLTTLVALTLICFAISYIVFMSQEIRS